MKPKPPQRLWLDSAAEPPSGWLRCPTVEAVRLLRIRKVNSRLCELSQFVLFKSGRPGLGDNAENLAGAAKAKALLGRQ